MFQHTVRTAAYQQSAKKPALKFKCHDLTLHQAAESTVGEFKALARMTICKVCSEATELNISLNSIKFRLWHMLTIVYWTGSEFTITSINVLKL